MLSLYRRIQPNHAAVVSRISDDCLTLAITGENPLQKCHINFGITGEMPIVLLSSWNLELYVRGHYVYKDVWTPSIAEKLLCKMEPNNIKDIIQCVYKNMA